MTTEHNKCIPDELNNLLLKVQHITEIKYIVIISSFPELDNLESKRNYNKTKASAVNMPRFCLTILSLSPASLHRFSLRNENLMVSAVASSHPAVAPVQQAILNH